MHSVVSAAVRFGLLQIAVRCIASDTFEHNIPVVGGGSATPVLWSWGGGCRPVISNLISACIVTFSLDTLEQPEQGEALPRAPGRRVRLIALCVASLWESAPPGNPQQKKKPEQSDKAINSKHQQSLPS
jgi:hypothetical protein